MTDFLAWLDASPGWYWSVCALMYTGVVALAVFAPAGQTGSRFLEKPGWRWLGSDLAFIVALAAMLLAFRWPFFYFPHQMNPDESGRISQILTLRDDLVFWRSVSAGTSGPLNVYPQALLSLLGVPYTFFTDRVFGLSLVIASLSFFYFTCRSLAPPAFARLGTLGPATFFALTTSFDFIHCSGEHLPMLLLTAASCLALRLAGSRGNPARQAFLAGCLLGAVPFAKLQAGVIALTIAALCGGFLLLRDEPWRRRLRLCGWLTLGGVAIPATILLVTVSSGAFEHFWQSYIVMNLGYVANGATLTDYLGSIPSWSFAMREYLTFLKAMLMIGLAGLAWITLLGGWKSIGTTGLRVLVFSSAIAGVALFSAVAPRRPFLHYFLLTVLPLAGWAFSTLSVCLNRKPAPGAPKDATRFAVFCWVAFGLMLQGGDFALAKPLIPVRGHVREYQQTPRSDVAQTILRFASPGEPLAVWGWMNEFHVETGMKRATSDMVLEYLWNVNLQDRGLANYIELIPEYYKELYLEDIRRSRPPVFVDAVAPGSFIFADRQRFGYESFPALASFVDENYEFVREINRIRIYVRKDRRAAAGAPRGGE